MGEWAWWEGRGAVILRPASPWCSDGRLSSQLMPQAAREWELLLAFSQEESSREDLVKAQEVLFDIFTKGLERE